MQNNKPWVDKITPENLPNEDLKMVALLLGLEAAIKLMTNGQLNSFYNRSYNESNKAKNKMERTSNAKTKAKYQKIYDAHNNNFWAANKERNIRGLDGKDW